MNKKKLISIIMVASYLSNQPVYVFAQEQNNIINEDVKQKVEKNIHNNKDNSLYEIYLDGSKETSGSGKTADDPVNNIEEALELVANYGIIYVTGEVNILDDLKIPNKVVTIKQHQGKEKGRLVFNKKLYLNHMLYVNDIEMEFLSQDKDCIFLNGNYMEVNNTSIFGKPNIFTGSENIESGSDRGGSINIFNDKMDKNPIGNIYLGGKNGNTSCVGSAELKGVIVEGKVDGKNINERSYLVVDGSVIINKVSNINKLTIYKEANLQLINGAENILELYASGKIKINYGTKILADYIYGDLNLDINMVDVEEHVWKEHFRAKRFDGNINLSDNLKDEGYSFNKINEGDEIVCILSNFTPNKTNYKPTIKNLRNIVSREGISLDLKKGVEAWDYEDGDITNKLIYPKDNIESLPVGTHTLVYEVTDSDGNRVIMNRMLYIIANSDPIISGVNDITIKVGDVDEFNKNLLKGVTVRDNKDEIDPSSIEVLGKVGKPNVKEDKKYELIYRVSDSDGNITEVKRIVTVTNRAPEIIANDITIKSKEKIDLLNDERIGLNANDHEDGNKKNDIVVKSTGGLEPLNPKEGEYKIVYEVKDSDGNTVEKEIRVVVKSNNSPKIIGAENITIKIGEVDKFNLLEGITVEDDYDKNLIPVIKGKIEKPSVGEKKNSTIVYSVKDSDGNITEVKRIITVTNMAPEILGVSDMKITQGYDFQKLKGVKAIDVEDGDITDRITITGYIDTDKLGEYELLYSVKDDDGNVTRIKRNIIVNPKTSKINNVPIINAKDIEINIGESFKPLEGVIASDIEDGDLTSKIKVIENDVDTKVEGIYKVVYEVEDKDGAKFKKSITVKVINIDKNDNENNIGPEISDDIVLDDNKEDIKPQNPDNYEDSEVVVQDDNNNKNNLENSSIDKNEIKPIDKLPNTGFKQTFPIFGTLITSIGIVLASKKNKKEK